MYVTYDYDQGVSRERERKGVAVTASGGGSGGGGGGGGGGGCGGGRGRVKTQRPLRPHFCLNSTKRKGLLPEGEMEELKGEERRGEGGGKKEE